MTISLALTTDSFTAGSYTYEVSSGVYFVVRRVDENVAYTASVAVPVSGYIIYLDVTDSGGNETRALQPVVIGMKGSCCTLTPITDTSLNGTVLTDANLAGVTLEVTYDA